jgi:hypothetical protein
MFINTRANLLGGALESVDVDVEVVAGGLAAIGPPAFVAIDVVVEEVVEVECSNVLETSTFEVVTVTLVLVVLVTALALGGRGTRVGRAVAADSDGLRRLFTPPRVVEA